jgi:inner membrane protein
MRWQYHKLTSGAAIYAVTGGYIPTCMAMIGSIMPDLMEMGIVRHRTVTHWPLPWIILALVSYETCRLSPNIWIYIFTFICIGALLHLGEDYLSVTGIPFRLPVSTRRKGLGMYVTGTMGETILAISIIGLFLSIAWLRGFFTTGHAMEEIVKVKFLTALFWR